MKIVSTIVVKIIFLNYQLLCKTILFKLKFFVPIIQLKLCVLYLDTLFNLVF